KTRRTTRSRRRRHQRRGIKNGSNYCYLNASIQMLLALPGVRTMVFRSMSGMVPGNDVDTNNTCPTKEDVMKVMMAAKRFKEGGAMRADGDTVLMAKKITVHVLGWAFKYGTNERASSGTRLGSTRGKHV
ncbi:unnamed protein product, partial [Ectocarpus sp. 12 AP-2014]